MSKIKIPNVKALIFMKGNSERVPNKNMRDFFGKPLYHWIINNLLLSQYISEIIINTDSEEIADNARENFKVTIHKRPKYLLDIDSNEANQIIEYDIQNTKGEFFIQSHSTNPLLSNKTIDKAIEVFFRVKNQSLFSVTEVFKRYYNFENEPINHDPMSLVKTQNMKPVYEENSCIYIFSRKSFNENKNRIDRNPYLFKIKELEAVDIDYPLDFEFAEFIADKIYKGKIKN